MIDIKIYHERLFRQSIGLSADTKAKDKLLSRLFDIHHHLEINAANLANYAQRYFSDLLPLKFFAVATLQSWGVKVVLKRELS